MRHSRKRSRCDCSTILSAAFALISAPAWSSEFSAAGIFTSNYFYRGYSKSDNRPTVRGTVDYEHDSGLYAGTWLSWVDFGDGGYPGHSDIEIYPYIGYVQPFSDAVRGELAVSRYIYNDYVFGRYSDFNEYSLAFHFRDIATLRLDYADDAYHRGKPTLNAEVSGRYPVTESVEFSGGLGYFDARSVTEYNTLYWHGGFTWYWHNVALDFRYVDSLYLATVPPGAMPIRDAILFDVIEPKFVFSMTVGY